MVDAPAIFLQVRSQKRRLPRPNGISRNGLEKFIPQLPKQRDRGFEIAQAPGPVVGLALYRERSPIADGFELKQKALHGDVDRAERALLAKGPGYVFRRPCAILAMNAQ